MNAQQVIQKLDIPDRLEKQLLLHLAKAFDDLTPASLYMDYYELARGYSPDENRQRRNNDLPEFHGIENTTPEQWESFLDIPELYRYRHGKIAKLQEFAAIKAIKSLEAQGQTASASAVSALKEITKLSKQLSSNNQNKQKIIMSYVTPKPHQKGATT
jgi:hypothetical protein